MPKVVHLTSAHPIDDSRVFLKECCSLHPTYNVVLIAPHSHDCTINGINIRAVKPTSSRFKRLFFSVGSIYKKALVEKADLYHFHDPELIIIGILLKCHGKKVIYDVHEDMPSDILHKPYLPKRLRPLLALLMRGFNKLAAQLLDHIITATPQISSQFPAQKTTLIRNFAIISEFKSHTPTHYQQRAPQCTYIGTITPERGLAKMIEAFSLLPPSLNITLQLAGRCHPDNLLQQYSHLKSTVHYLGILDRPSIIKHLHSSRIALLLLPPTPGFLESYPIKLFEYMAAGLPIVASHFPTWRSFIEDNQCGILVDPSDTQAIANAIEYLITHPKNAEILGKNGQQAAEKYYSWSTEANKLMACYRQLRLP